MLVYRNAIVALLLAVCGLALPVTRSAAAEDIWNLMPDNTLAFAVVNDPADLSQKLTELGDRIGTPMPDPLVQLRDVGPAMREVDADRPWGLVLVPDRAAPTGFVLLIYLPVDDFAAFAEAAGADDPQEERAAFHFQGNDVVAASVDGYAVLVNARYAAHLETVEATDGSIAEDFADLRDRLDDADIMAGVTRSGITNAARALREQIEQVKQQIGQVGPGQPGAVPPQAAIEGLNFYVMLADAMERNAEKIGFELNIEDDAIRGRDILVFREDRCFEEFEDLETIGEDPFKGLPPGQVAFLLVGVTPGALTDQMLAFSKQTMLSMQGIYGLDERQVEQIIEQSRPLIEPMRRMALSIQTPRDPDAPLYAGSGGFIRIDGDAEEYLDEYADVVRQMAEKMETEDQGLFNLVPPRRIEVEGRPGLQFSMTVDMARTIEDPAAREAITAMLERFYGPDGRLDVYLLAVDDETIAFGYVSRANLRRYAAAVSGENDDARGLMDRPAYRRLAEMLPDDVQWVGVLDLAGYREMLVRVMGPLGGLIPDVGPAAPIGFGVKLSPDRVEAESVAPIGTIRAIANVFNQAGQQSPNARQPRSPRAETPATVE